ncbi:MAG: zinc ribbon domain-containing protein [Ruminococcaceae bacterium]|nr:zinc ribbon domain-containing protein [Oscillospiraceae bacterium]
MAFFSELTQKAKGVAAVAADKAKDAAELTKLSVAISGEQREIDKNYRAIGEWFVNEFEGEIPDGVKDLVQAVADSKAKIAELEAAKAATKTEKEPAGEKTCPICGAVSDSRFCPQCGAPMDA